MKRMDDDATTRVNRAEMLRALNAHERKAAELREKLGLFTREVYHTVDRKEASEQSIVRMRTDQVDRLYEAERLNAAQRGAALKFRQIWEAFSRGLFPGAGSIGGMVGTKSRGRYRHPLERMTNRELFIWVKEYKPWATGIGAKTAFQTEYPDHPPFIRSYLQVTYAVVVDNYGPSQLEKEWPIPKGKGLITGALAYALDHWNHIDYNEDEDIESVRRQIIEISRERVEETMPRKRA